MLEDPLDVDLVLLDVVMPVGSLDGYEVCRRIRALGADGEHRPL